MAISVSFPLACWVGLAVGTSEVSDEITSAGYARQPATFVMTADGVTAANANTIAWCPAKQGWGSITVCQIWDAPTGGNLLGEVPTITPVSVALYDQLRIPAGGFLIAGATRIPYGFGTGTFGIGRYNTRQWIDGVGSGIGSPYGVGPYGVGPYAATVQGALLQKAWATVGSCTAGTWAPALECNCP